MSIGGSIRSELRSPLREVVTQRVTTASIVVSASGLGLVVVGALLKGAPSAVLEGLGSTIASVGLITLVYEIYLRRSFTAEFLAAADLREDVWFRG